jgi:hypothetical protein
MYRFLTPTLSKVTVMMRANHGNAPFATLAIFAKSTMNFPALEREIFFIRAERIIAGMTSTE